MYILGAVNGVIQIRVVETVRRSNNRFEQIVFAALPPAQHALDSTFVDIGFHGHVANVT